jgi:hypothetical protein
MTVPITATQGVLFTEVFAALDHLFETITELQSQRIVRWFFPGRPAIEGADTFVWYRLNDAGVGPSTGPGRYGNKANLDFTVSLETRFAVGKSQVDNRRIDNHYITYWKMYQALQNNMLFSEYLPAEQPLDGDIWLPPVPVAGLPPLTVETMLFKSAPGGEKVQKEEWTLTTAFGLLVPCVLKLIVPM